MEEKNEDLEKKVARKGDPIICEFPNCIIRGSYYKCYFETYQTVRQRMHVGFDLHGA